MNKNITTPSQSSSIRSVRDLEQVDERRRLAIRPGILYSLGLFLLAFMPRVFGLEAFISPDAWDWVEGSRDFLLGLVNGDLTQTLHTGIPGVTTMWTGSLAILYKYLTRPEAAPDRLSNFVATVPTNPLDVDYIAIMRLPTVILTALSVVAFFWLTARLFDRHIALVAACLLALEPLHIAHSRVLHQDALNTTFMTLSVLPMIGYWLHGWGRRWLVMSGTMAGLAFLSKSSAMLLMPFCATVGVWACLLQWRWGEQTREAAIRRLIIGGILWTATAWLTYGAFWPAMWVEPVTVLNTVFTLISRHVSEGPDDMGHYFLGEYTHNPGLLFYPLIWLLRATPLNLLGLGVLLISGRRRHRLHFAPDKRQTLTIYMYVTYVLFYVMVMALSAKKQDRYILPIFPALEVLAGLGLVRLWQIATNKWRRASLAKPGTASQWLKARDFLRPDLNYRLLVASIVIVQAAFALPHYPYYLTYYNPLLGGGRTAERLITIGWGEGLDLAATYLNQKPNADRLKVTAWYSSAFAPYFRGQSTYFLLDDIGHAMSSDYLVLYRNQLQRQLPTPHLLAYFQRHHTPEYVARLKGIDYALVYAVPLDYRTAWQSTNIPGKLTMYGYRQVNAPPGMLSLRVVWEYQGMPTRDSFWIALQHFEGQAGQSESKALAWQACKLAPGFSLAETQQIGVLLESTCEVDVRNTMPGIYRLHIGVGPADSVQNLPVAQHMVDLLAPQGALGVSVTAEGIVSLIAPDEALDALARKVLPSGASPLHVSYGGMIGLVGYDVNVPSLQSDQIITVNLYWQALEDISQPASLAEDFQVQFGLLTPDGGLAAETTEDLLSGVEASDVWRLGEVLSDPHSVPVRDQMPPGNYLLVIALTRADNGKLVPFRDDANGLLIADHIQLGTSLVVQ